jgi:alpha-galactosidase/6-phospho-beta-glucosidase family protein
MIEELCPDAWVISYINPTNFVADAVRRVTKAKFVAICDGITGCTALHLPGILDVPPEDVSARAIGFNHATWVVDLRVRGEDGYPLFRERLAGFEFPEVYGHYSRASWEFARRLCQALGYWNVTPAHCWMMWEHDEVLRERRSRPLDLDSHQARIQSFWEFVQQMVDGAEYDPDRPFLHNIHALQPVGIMVSIATDEGREWGGINLPNNGVISNLPAGAIVEVPCIVDARGPVPIAMGDMPSSLLGHTQHLINWQELSVDAALSGDKGTLYQALLACPYVQDMKVAKVIMDELLAAHADYMPQFR